MSATEHPGPGGGETSARDNPAGLETPVTGLNAHDATELRRPVLERSKLSSPTPTPSTSTAVGPLTFASSVFAQSTGSNGASIAVSESASGSQENGPVEEEEDTDDGSRVSAYARLDFESFTFYVQTLQVILGRRAENGNSMVDVHLGPTKAISRRHAKIFYNFATQRFEITVIGRNGAFVGDVFVETGSTVPLWDSTRVQIGQITFTFVLPSVPTALDGPQANTLPEEAYDAASGSDGEATSVSSRAASGSPAPRNTKREPKLKLDGGDENNFFAVTAAEKALTDKQPTSRRKPKREYKPEEIPPQYREKPSHSYSHLITTALQQRPAHVGMTLADIYEGIMDIFPYYRYAPAGWQNSVRHNLSSSKAFRKVSKEGKGWLWGLDEEYMAEKELQKQRAALKQAQSRTNSMEGGQKTIAQLAQEIPPRDYSSGLKRDSGNSASAGGQAGLSQDTVKLLATLQHKLTTQLTNAGHPGINRQLLTNSLAVVIAQAAKSSGGINNLNTMLQNPQALQRLMVQALEFMKKQTQPTQGAATGTNSGTPSSVPSQLQTIPQPVIGSSSVPAAGPSNGLTEAIKQEVTTASPEVANRDGATPIAEQTPAEPPIPLTDSNPAVSATSLQNAPVKPEPSHTSRSATPQNGVRAPASQSGAKPPMTKEKIAELLAQAEKIPNPSPSILAAIEQLKAHQRAMNLKRPAEDVEAQQPAKKAQV